MCDVNVGSGVCRFVYRKHYFDRSDGEDSEGEVNEWLRNVSGQWSGHGGQATRMGRHDRGSRGWVLYGSMCLQWVAGVQ